MKILLTLIIFCFAFVNGKSFSLMHPDYNIKAETNGITLNGILFVSDKEWVIWVNHKRITPNKNPEWLKVTKVTESCVQCEYLHHNLWYQVTLEPYDTFTPAIKQNEDATQVEHKQN